MNNDLISREVLKELIDDKMDMRYRWDSKLTVCEFKTIVGDIIDNAPTVEAVPLDFHEKCMDKTVRELLEVRTKGEWIWSDNRWGLGDYLCNKCGHYAHDKHKFCPNCGADMRGGGDK